MAKHVIWRDKATESEVCAESMGMDYKARAVQEIASAVVDALRISWQEKRVVRRLLVSAAGGDIADILMQFLHSQLEIVGEELNRQFGIDETIETGYATHAKLKRFIQAIKVRIEQPDCEILQSEKGEKK